MQQSADQWQVSPVLSRQLRQRGKMLCHHCTGLIISPRLSFSHLTVLQCCYNYDCSVLCIRVYGSYLPLNQWASLNEMQHIRRLMTSVRFKKRFFINPNCFDFHIYQPLVILCSAFAFVSRSTFIVTLYACHEMHHTWTPPSKLAGLPPIYTLYLANNSSG